MLILPCLISPLIYIYVRLKANKRKRIFKNKYEKLYGYNMDSRRITDVTTEEIDDNSLY